MRMTPSILRSQRVRAPRTPGSVLGRAPGSTLVAALLASVLLVMPGAPAPGVGPSDLAAQSLRGGQASLDRQNHQARAHDFSYLQTPEQVAQFVEAGYLVPVVANADFDVHNVSFPYARPEVGLFIERLAAQYRSACGEKLVITSLTRPISTQPANASHRSVHPTGMAVDLRRSESPACRQWLESTLLSLEGQGLIEAIYERNPPHYHLAVYPDPYIRYVERQTGQTRLAQRIREERPQVVVDWVTHQVRRGETLTAISSRYGVAMARIRAENGIRGSNIHVGQALRIPQYRAVRAPVTRQADARTSAPSAASTGPDVAADGEASSAGATSGEATAGEVTPGDAGTTGTVVHQVRRGESLWVIARTYGVTEADLRRANGIRGSRIVVGQELEVPGVATAPGGAFQHEVRRGESLWTIARQHGTTVDELRRINGIVGGPLQPGQILEVPTGP